jgi:hypothetical protein
VATTSTVDAALVEPGAGDCSTTTGVPASVPVVNDQVKSDDSALPAESLTPEAPPRMRAL